MTRKETIRCPKCETMQEATIEHKECEPFPRYVHQCTSCFYWITESEWEAAK